MPTDVINSSLVH